MEIPKIKRGDRLQVVLLQLSVGECVKVPYRLYSENSLRVTLSQLKARGNAEFEIDTRSNVSAIITRRV